MLAAMGITVWRQREPQIETPVLPRLICVAQSAQADHALLSNILKAIQCDLQNAKMILVDNPSELTTHTWPNVPIIVFGESLYAYTPTTAIRTVPLTDLSQNIPAKKALWQALKTLS